MAKAANIPIYYSVLDAKADYAFQIAAFQTAVQKTIHRQAVVFEQVFRHTCQNRHEYFLRFAVFI